MGVGELDEGETPQQGQLRQLKHAHPYLFALSHGFFYVHDQLRNVRTVIFATWPSMHDPIPFLLNEADDHEADHLTEKWTDAKLKDLQYVGLSVYRTTPFSSFPSVLPFFHLDIGVPRILIFPNRDYRALW